MGATERNVIIGEIEGENGEEKIELVLDQAGGDTTLRLRALRWGQGIGWFVHKTIALDAAQVRVLKRLLRRSPVAAESKTGCKVIPLPRWKEISDDALS